MNSRIGSFAVVMWMFIALLGSQARAGTGIFPADEWEQATPEFVWVIHMSAAALVFADNGGGNSSAGFSGDLDPASAQQARHDIVARVWDLADQFPFYRMSPRANVVDTGYCIADPGHDYLVYLPSAETVHVRLADGPYQVEWINPRSGQRHAAGRTVDGRNLAPPDTDGDWLVSLVRE